MRRLPTFAPWMMSVWLHGCALLLAWMFGWFIGFDEAIAGEGGPDAAGEGALAGEVGSGEEGSPPQDAPKTPLEQLQAALDAAQALNSQLLVALNGPQDPVSISIYEEVSTLEPGDEAPEPTPTPEANARPPQPTPLARLPANSTSGNSTAGGSGGGTGAGNGNSAGNGSSQSPGTMGGTGEGKGHGNKKPCVPVEGITQLDTTTWTVERALVNYYATNLNALDRLGAIKTHNGPDGKPDGLWVGLSRCSALKQGGIKHNDIVRKVNGMQVNSVTDAVAAWFKYQGKGTIKIELTRAGQTVVYTYKITK